MSRTAVMEKSFSNEAGALLTSAASEKIVSLVFGSTKIIPGWLRVGEDANFTKFAGTVSACAGTLWLVKIRTVDTTADTLISRLRIVELCLHCLRIYGLRCSSEE